MNGMNERQAAEVNALFDLALTGLAKAVKKHPQFCAKATVGSLDEVRAALKREREWNDSCVAKGGLPNFDNILNEELLEYLEAAVSGDKKAAKHEIVDCVIVLIREWLRVSAPDEARA